jgi:dolichyl-diphosphooligosaccharide--protein glycosyltransferase
VAQQTRFAPSDAWQSALFWMRENTPEPFGDPDFYYEFYQPGVRDYPESSYGVINWWDYGYWVTRIARRVPIANPSQPPDRITDIARFFLSQDESQSREMIQKLDASYVVIDYMTATSKYWAVIDWSGKEVAEFFDIYLVPVEGQFAEILFYNPEYYSSLCARLYNFDGKAVTDAEPWVIAFDVVATSDGPRKRVTDAKQFPSYEGALDYIQGQESDNYRIVGTNPFVTPVPLEAVEDYKLVYSSDIGEMLPEAGMMPEVKIFEYTGDRG